MSSTTQLTGSTGVATATSVIHAALEIVEGKRDLRGTPERNLKRIADLWGSYLGIELSPVAVANMMILLKIGRINTGQRDWDNYVDIIGYAALAAEVDSAVH